MARGWTVLIPLVAACDLPPERIEITSPAARAPDRDVAGAPHGAVIQHVAVTEGGDAALSSDGVGTVRLWPSLDGSRQAIPIASSPPRGLALGVAGDELVATIIDQASLAHVLRLGRDGTLHGRADLPGDIAVRQVIAVGGDLLVVRVDESIERYDASGGPHGRIAARGGERIGTVATRGGAAIASIVSSDPRAATSVRWISLADELAWGDELALPAPIDPTELALSPGRKRLAVGGNRAAELAPQLVIYSLGKQITPYVTPGIDVVHGSQLGFTDDEHLAVIGERIDWWGRRVDPWAAAAPAPPRGPVVRPFNAGAVADGVVVAGFAAGLELETSQTSRYLGWAELSFGIPMPIGDHIAYGPNAEHFTWLDASLHEERTIATSVLAVHPPQAIVALDDHRVAVAADAGGGATVDLVDTAQPAKPTRLGVFNLVERIDYAPALAILSVTTDKSIERYHLDLEHLAATRLAALPVRASTVLFVQALDPARADGLSAVVVDLDEDEERVHEFRGTTHVTHRMRSTRGAALAVTTTGAVLVRPENEPSLLVAQRGGRELARFAVDGEPPSAAANHAGDAFAFAAQNQVVVVDAGGAVRWKHPLWGAAMAAFSGDDRRLIVRVNTGLVALDAANGNELARACGWAFGLHDSPLPTMTYGQAPVCEDAGP